MKILFFWINNKSKGVPSQADHIAVAKSYEIIN